MNAIVETARTKSKVGKKALTVVTEEERPAFDHLCGKLSEIVLAEAENAAEIMSLRNRKAGTAEAMAARDLTALRAATELESKAGEREAFTTAMATNLRCYRERLWRDQGEVVLGVLRRAHAEALKRHAKLVADEISESGATGEAASVQSAGAAFLRKRIKSIETDIANPDRRLRNIRCAKRFLRDHAIDPGE